MKNIYIYILLIMVSFITISCKKDSQPNNSGRFMKFYGAGLIDFAYDIKQTSSGDYIIAGYTENSFQRRQALAIKTDLLGNLIWQKSFGDLSNFSEFKKVKVYDDGFVFLGTYEDTIPEISKEIYLLKTNFEGEILWEETHGGVENQEGNDFDIMPNGDFILAGSSTKANNQAVGSATGVNAVGVKDCYLIRVVPEKDSIIKTLQMGGRNDDIINSITITNSGTRIYCASILNYDINFGDKQLSGDNMSIIRIDAEGQKFAQGPQLSFGSTGNDRLIKILPDGTENLIVAGNQNNNETAIINKVLDRENMRDEGIDNVSYNLALNTIEDVDELIISDISRTMDGGFIITGESNSTTSIEGNGMALINIDSEGELVWYRIDSDVSGVNKGQAIISTQDGGYAVVGNTGFGVDGDIMLLKVNKEGVL